jgi:8-oxo-dGTP diphosphatase
VSADLVAVVGAAVIRDGRVLAARRTRPAAAAGRWEFPGGKVEAGETPDDALVREIREELGCDVVVERWLAGSAAIGPRHELTVAVVRLASGEPVPHEHDAVRWLSAPELGDVDWLEPDRPFLAELGRLLAEHPSGRRRGPELGRH